MKKNKLPITNKKIWRNSILGFLADTTMGYQEFHYYDFSDDKYSVHRMYNSRNDANKRFEGIMIIWDNDPFNLDGIQKKRIFDL